MYANLGPEYFSGHGFLPLYRLEEVNRCPACLMSNWYIGRSTAECAFCGTALPLEHTGLEGVSLGGLYWDRDVLRYGRHVQGHRPGSTGDPSEEWEI